MKLFFFVFMTIFLVNFGLGQKPISCNIPYHVTADSLMNFVSYDLKKRTGIKNTDWKKRIVEKTKGINLDSAYNQCQDYLVEKLGDYIYCNFIDLCPNSFDANGNNFDFSVGFQLPNLKNKHKGGYREYLYETVLINFKIKRQSDKTFKIIYPTNVPDCKGLPDCGFVITKEKAIEIAKESGFLVIQDKYRIEPDGINWVITLNEDKHGQVKSININIQTGEKSKVKMMQRID